MAGLVSNSLTDRWLGSAGKVLCPDSPMLIVCPSCATSYDVDLASLEPDGRQVRCVRCRTVWHAEPVQIEKLLAAAGAAAPPTGATKKAAGTVGRTAPMRPSENFSKTVSEASRSVESTLTADRLRAAASDPSAGAAETGAEPGVPGDPDSVESPPIAPGDVEMNHPLVAVAAAGPGNVLPEDIETYAARRQRRGAMRTSLRWPLSRLQNGILALLIIDAVLIGWRNDVVRVLPQTASFYAMLGLSVNLRGLAFDDITTTTEQHEGVPILVVEGNIVNATSKTVDVPRLKFAARNAVHEEIYSWTAVPPRPTLPPGEAVEFRSRLASPPTEVRDVMVRFVTRRDVLAGSH